MSSTFVSTYSTTPHTPDWSTIGYYSAYTSGSITIYGTSTYDAKLQVFDTMGSAVELCSDPYGNCTPLYTACSTGAYGQNYILYSTFTGTCSVCVANTIYSSFGASSGYTQYTCTNQTPRTVYRVSPVQTTSTSKSSTSSRSSLTPFPLPGPPKSTNNTGIIVGAVIGGLAVLGIIVVAVVFLLLRHKRASQAAVLEYRPYSVATVTTVPNGDLPIYTGKP
ncbi:hypothetical protein B0J11DRAFT_235610 [Dendryphion nanum]|uniref:Uncharacterized protein n=1 Tax=Dendryphion nanum TaxID=256645 RepID=A0A9P9I6J5_9PLEO|nr:hypothetical protein B0J11DRAFT_235610 [Dendryphion nanum]